MNSVYRKIYAAVGRIPKGRVATYGQIARLAGIPRGARQVGYALSALPSDFGPGPVHVPARLRGGDRLPWHRVVNAAGGISGRSEPRFEEEQRERLESEGVRFGADGRIPLRRFRWKAGAGR